MGQHARTGSRFDLAPVARLAQVGGRALDEVLGMRLNPGMVQPDMVGHEIEQQTDLPLLQTLPQTNQGRVAAVVAVYPIGLDGER